MWCMRTVVVGYQHWRGLPHNFRAYLWFFWGPPSLRYKLVPVWVMAEIARQAVVSSYETNFCCYQALTQFFLFSVQWRTVTNANWAFYIYFLFKNEYRVSVFLPPILSCKHTCLSNKNHRWATIGSGWFAFCLRRTSVDSLIKACRVFSIFYNRWATQTNANSKIWTPKSVAGCANLCFHWALVVNIMCLEAINNR